MIKLLREFIVWNIYGLQLENYSLRQVQGVVESNPPLKNSLYNSQRTFYPLSE